MRRNLLTTALLVAALGVAPKAVATPLFDLAIVPGDANGDFDIPKITLTNASTAGEQITSFSLSIGAPGFVYDYVLGNAGNPRGQAANLATETTTGATLVAGDRGNGGSSVTTLTWSFAHFAAAEWLIFETDIDRSPGNPAVDARSVWFNNGAAANAQIQIQFSSGWPVTFVLPDAAGPPSSFAFTGVPEPTTLALLAAGLFGLGARRKAA